MGRAYSTLTQNGCQCVHKGTYFNNNLLHLLVNPFVILLTCSPLAVSYSSFRRPLYTWDRIDRVQKTKLWQTWWAQNIYCCQIANLLSPLKTYVKHVIWHVKLLCVCQQSTFMGFVYFIE